MFRSFNSLDNMVRPLCTPSMIYLVISLLSLVGIIFQNILMGNKKTVVCGNYKANLDDDCSILSGPGMQITAILADGIYIIFWTWIINLLCKSGHRDFAWFFVIFPITLTFVIISFVLVVIGAEKINKNDNGCT